MLFSKREIRAVAVLLPFVGICVAIALSMLGGGHDRVREKLADNIVDNNQTDSAVSKPNAFDEQQKELATAVLVDFDPNTVTYEQLRAMNFAKSTAAAIIKYRERGKRFEIAEDFATCYGVTDSMFALLRPHIHIGREYALKPFEHSEKSYGGTKTRVSNDGFVRSDSLFAFNPNELDVDGFRLLGFTARQSEAMVEYRERIGGFRSVAEFEECYLVSRKQFERLKEFLTIPAAEKRESRVELNSADSAALVALYGIGARSAKAIIDYRNRLGGYFAIEQLAELSVVTEKNFELFSSKIFVDTCRIVKIDINFAPPKELSSHPYMAGKTLGKILKNRQLKGGWTRIEEMVNDNTLSVDEARRLRPYLVFGTIEKEF